VPPGFDPITLAFRGNGRQIASIEVSVNAPLRDAAMQLWVMRQIAEPYGYPAIGPAPCRQVVFQRQLPMTNIPSPPEGPRGTVALSAWSGTLVPGDWEGGCLKALYAVQAEVAPVVPSGYAEGMRVGSAYFTCRLGWWAAAWSNIVPLNDRWGC
jgi:hypothetical protein